MAMHVLENEYLKVMIADAGAELSSVFDKETDTERLWNADPTVWNRHAPILFPFVGRVIGGVYRIGDKEYTMKTQHGFAAPDKEFKLETENGFIKFNDTIPDTWIFDYQNIDTIRIARPDKTPAITMNCGEFSFLAVWAKKTGTFICLESWVGRTDDDGFAGTLEEKTGEENGERTGKSDHHGRATSGTSFCRMLKCLS